MEVIIDGVKYAPVEEKQDKYSEIQIGDKVRIVRKQGINHCHSIGDISTVEEIHTGDAWLKVGGYHQWVSLCDIEKITSEQDKTVKLYCVKDYKPGEWLTKGKVYDVSNNIITYDDGWDTVWFLHNTVNEKPVLGHYCFPLVARPAKVGEWVYVISGGTCGCSVGNIYEAIALHKQDYGVYVKTKKQGECACTQADRPITTPADYLFHVDYLVLDNYQPEPETCKCCGRVIE